MLTLIEKLKNKQGQGRMTRAEFAELLGITQATLSRIYSGDRRVSRSLAKRIRTLYPDLTFALADYILGDDPVESDGIGVAHG